jgi:hypothetical protein
MPFAILHLDTYPELLRHYEQTCRCGPLRREWPRILRREAPTPRSSLDWGELRVNADTHTVRHKATIADACS